MNAPNKSAENVPNKTPEQKATTSNSSGQAQLKASRSGIATNSKVSERINKQQEELKNNKLLSNEQQQQLVNCSGLKL